MTTNSELQAQINGLQGQLDSLSSQIAPAIAEGLRLYADRPVGEKGAPSLQFGVVDGVFDTYASVILDGETQGVPINMLGGLIEGERVAVLMVPPSGNLAIGMVTPSTPSPGVPPGGTTGQVLTKIDGTDFNDDWETPAAGSGFPVGPEDDGTETGTVEFGTIFGSPLPGALGMSVYSDATPSDNSYAFVFEPASGGIGATMQSSVGDVTLRGVGQDVVLSATSGSSVIFNTAPVNMGSLPTADPHNVGDLFMTGYVLGVTPGTLMVSAGHSDDERRVALVGVWRVGPLG